MPWFASPFVTVLTATAVVALAAALALLGLAYRGEEFAAWLRRNASPITVGGGGAATVIVVVAVTASLGLPAPVLWTAVGIIVGATVLLAVAVVRWPEAFRRRPGRVSAGNGTERPGHDDSSEPFGLSTADGSRPTALYMPPSSVRTLEDLIYWQSAKIMTRPASRPRQYALAVDRLARIRSGEIRPDAGEEALRRGPPSRCDLCGGEGPLTEDPVFARLTAGRSDAGVGLWLCPSCRASKDSRGLYEYWVDGAAPARARDGPPHVAEGAYLRLLKDLFTRADVLDWKERNLHAKVCPSCQLRSVCQQQGVELKLSPLCLDAVAAYLGGPTVAVGADPVGPPAHPAGG